MALTPGDGAIVGIGPMRLAAPRAAATEWPNAAPTLAPFTSTDFGDGTGLPPAPKARAYFSPIGFDYAVQLFTQMKGDLYRKDPTAFFEDVSKLYGKSTSEHQQTRREAARYTSGIIVAGVVELLNRDLTEFVRTGSYAFPEKYKCRPAAVIYGIKQAIGAVGRAETSDPENWSIGRGLLEKFELAARVANPPAHTELYDRAVRHTNLPGDHLREPWEDAGLLSLLAQELTNHCIATGQSLRVIVQQSHAASQALREQANTFPGDKFKVLSGHALANFVHKAALVAQNKHEEQQALERRVQFANQLELDLFETNG